MSTFDVNSMHAVCRRCGTAYTRLKGYFPISYAVLYKGTGFIPYCRECIDTMYNEYFDESKSARLAVMQMCRKLDLYWNEKLFEVAEKQNATRTMMTAYMMKVNALKYAGKCYDDTLRERKTFWQFADISGGAVVYEEPQKEEEQAVQEQPIQEEDIPEIGEDVIAFWGAGYTPSMYQQLEQRLSYWLESSKHGKSVDDLDIGTKALLRQICSLELDINRDRMAGKSVDKSVNALNALLGSAALKPAQKKEELADGVETTPLGVWIRRWENERPLPEIDPELKDVDGIVKYIEIWFKGHLAKMLGLKTAYSKMYEKEIERLRVEKPEFGDEEDEALFNEVFSNDYGGDENDES